MDIHKYSLDAATIRKLSNKLRTFRMVACLFERHGVFSEALLSLFSVLYLSFVIIIIMYIIWNFIVFSLCQIYH